MAKKTTSTEPQQRRTAATEGCGSEESEGEGRGGNEGQRRMGEGRVPRDGAAAPNPPPRPAGQSTRNSVASDADFLEKFAAVADSSAAAAAAAVVAAGSSTTATANSEEKNNSAAVWELHRSNLLRLQSQELVRECAFADGGTGSSSSSSWTSAAESYVRLVSELVEDGWRRGTKEGGEDYDSDLLSTMPFPTFSADAKKGNGASLKVEPGAGPPLKVEPCRANSIGGVLTHPSGNANVLPTFDVVVRIPNAVFAATAASSGDDGKTSPLSSKDYLKHRYYDVSCCCCQ
jgi:hypothetical protein